MNLTSLYEESFLKAFDNKNLNEYVGIELEFPLINIDEKPVNVSILQSLMRLLVKENFKVIEKDEDGLIISLIHNKYNDLISFEYTFNTIEFSMYKSQNIKEIKERFEKYFKKINNFLQKKNHVLLGAGVNPFYKVIDKKPLNTKKYKMIYNFLKLCAVEDSLDYDFCSYIASIQTHLDVDKENIPEVINLFSKISWLKSMIFSNSSFLENNIKFDCIRDEFWKKSMFGFNKKNIGVYDEKFENLDEVITHYLNKSIWYVKREERYIYFSPIELKDYLKKDCHEGFECLSNNVIKSTLITPNKNDIKYFRSYKNIEISNKGTLEIREDCQQLLGNEFVVPAFNAGLLENLDALKEFSEKKLKNNYKNSYLRELANKNELKLYSKSTLKKLLFELIKISENGLRKRRKGEEDLLLPIYNKLGIV